MESFSDEVTKTVVDVFLAEIVADRLFGDAVDGLLGEEEAVIFGEMDGGLRGESEGDGFRLPTTETPPLLEVVLEREIGKGG